MYTPGRGAFATSTEPPWRAQARRRQDALPRQPLAAGDASSGCKKKVKEKRWWHHGRRGARRGVASAASAESTGKDAKARRAEGPPIAKIHRVVPCGLPSNILVEKLVVWADSWQLFFPPGAGPRI